MRKKHVLGVLALAGLVFGGCCYLVHVEHHIGGLPLVHVAIPRNGSTNPAIASVSATPRIREPKEPMLPRAARAVADRYAVDALSTTAGEPSDAWIAVVASLCTSRWLASLRVAENGVIVAPPSANYRVIRTFPSEAPTSDVAATVLLGDGEDEASIYVVLVRVRDGYLVAGAQ